MILWLFPCLLRLLKDDASVYNSSKSKCFFAGNTLLMSFCMSPEYFVFLVSAPSDSGEDQ